MADKMDFQICVRLEKALNKAADATFTNGSRPRLHEIVGAIIQQPSRRCLRTRKNISETGGTSASVADAARSPALGARTRNGH